MSHTKPTVIDNIEAISTANFDVSPSNLFSKAKLDIKIDMVKPIPAKNPTPKNLVKVSLLGRLIIFVLTNIKAAVIIPSGLPRNKPDMIPIEIGDARFAKDDPEMYRLVLARAKMGIIIKLTGKFSTDSYFVILSIGNNRAIMIPPNVA